MSGAAGGRHVLTPLYLAQQQACSSASLSHTRMPEGGAGGARLCRRPPVATVRCVFVPPKKRAAAPRQQQHTWQVRSSSLLVSMFDDVVYPCCVALLWQPCAWPHLCPGGMCAVLDSFLRVCLILLAPADQGGRVWRLCARGFAFPLPCSGTRRCTAQQRFLLVWQGNSSDWQDQQNTLERANTQQTRSTQLHCTEITRTFFNSTETRPLPPAAALRGCAQVCC